MDTIYLLDYTIGANKFNSFKNESTIIYFDTIDSVILNANSKATRLKMSKLPSFHHSGFRITALRIIKEKNTSLIIRVKCKKVFDGQNFVLDSIVNLTSQINKTYVFWCILRDNPKFRFGYDPSFLEFTNKDFAFKNNFRRTKIREAIMNSVVYEYHYSERKLVKVK
ncbi:MAG: hypothetical protein K2X48_19230 [Chitinophagaceae bacterium]|nr:hypothetical protein [Chitinophagaceae bacterium]